MPGELPFDRGEYRARLDRVMMAMEARHLDTLLVFSPANTYYLTGLDIYGFILHHALVVSPRLPGLCLVHRILEAPGVRLTSLVTDAVYYEVPRDDPVRRVVETLRDRGLAAGVIGLEREALAAPLAERYAAALDGSRLVDASDLVPELRLVKSAAEVRYVRLAATLADLGLEAAIRAVRPGISEIELAAEAQRAMDRAGSEYPAIPVLLASGPRTPMIHGMPTRRRLAAGDLVTVEHAGVYCRYHVIVMRTLALGQPAARVRDVMRVQVEALEAAGAAVRPGAPVRAPHDACQRVLARAGLERYLLHRLGFSLGIAYPPAWLEPLSIWETDPHVFAPGMVFSLEPNLCLDAEGFATKLGDTTLMTAAGPERLSRVPRELLVRE